MKHDFVTSVKYNQVIKFDSRIRQDPIRNRWRYRRNSVELIESGLGITHGSLVLETDRILQSDPIGSDSRVKLHPIVLIK